MTLEKLNNLLFLSSLIWKKIIKASTSFFVYCLCYLMRLQKLCKIQNNDWQIVNIQNYFLKIYKLLFMIYFIIIDALIYVFLMPFHLSNIISGLWAQDIYWFFFDTVLLEDWRKNYGVGRVCFIKPLIDSVYLFCSQHICTSLACAYVSVLLKDPILQLQTQCSRHGLFSLSSQTPKYNCPCFS